MEWLKSTVNVGKYSIHGALISKKTPTYPFKYTPVFPLNHLKEILSYLYFWGWEGGQPKLYIKYQSFVAWTISTSG